MASFTEKLWESIFTPGTTPTLLIATNATFAALQLILGLLLWATYSVHFVVLSILCGGLWWAINWFAAELQVHQQQEVEKERRAGEAVPTHTSDDSDTEVDESIASLGRGRKGQGKVVSASSEVEPLEAHGELKQRGADTASQGTKSSASTEDEWEKLSENENEKDK